MIALRNILVATDFSQSSATALTYGRELARQFGATLHLIHVADDIGARFAIATDLPYDLGRAQMDVERTARDRIGALVTEQDRRELRMEVVLRTSTAPALAIASYAKESRADLIIVGTHGRGTVAHLFMGSVAERIIRTAPCPVLTVRHPEREFIEPDPLTVAARA